MFETTTRKYTHHTPEEKLERDLEVLRKRHARLTRQLADANAKTANWRARLEETEQGIKALETGLSSL